MIVRIVPRPDLIPVIRARLAKEWGCRESDINLTSVVDRVTETATIVTRPA